MSSGFPTLFFQNKKTFLGDLEFIEIKRQQRITQVEHYSLEKTKNFLFHTKN